VGPTPPPVTTLRVNRRWTNNREVVANARDVFFMLLAHYDVRSLPPTQCIMVIGVLIYFAF
jgi:hypothetical protein